MRETARKTEKARERERDIHRKREKLNSNQSEYMVTSYKRKVNILILKQNMFTSSIQFV